MMKDAVDVLKYCKERGYILGLVTNGKVDIQNTKIDTLALREYFKAIVISGEVEIAKPDPKIYQLALDRLGVTAEQTLFIGDHPVNDIWGAGKAGLQGIWLQRKHTWDDQLDIQPWKIIYELNELKSIL
ncbi:Pyrimidine 5'-nucleotidase YjjG [compost metagenome]